MDSLLQALIIAGASAGLSTWATTKVMGVRIASLETEVKLLRTRFHDIGNDVAALLALEHIRAKKAHPL